MLLGEYTLERANTHKSNPVRDLGYGKIGETAEMLANRCPPHK